jgi:murein DD-endopeptidase MepM/ murein hydrolase activator NlpD
MQGSRVDPITGKPGASHGGVDFAVGTGTPVFATASGKVQSAAFDTDGGNFITILHDDGKKSAYLHLSEMLVSSGQRVTAGQQIARSGNTGQRTTGAHLHFEVRRPASPKDVKLDPLDFLPGSFVVTDSLAKRLGRKTVSGGMGVLGLLLLGGAAYGGYRYYKKRSR